MSMEWTRSLWRHPAAAMELYEMGVPPEDTDGVELKFGNAEALTVMAEKTGKQEGLAKSWDGIDSCVKSMAILNCP